MSLQKKCIISDCYCQNQKCSHYLFKLCQSLSNKSSGWSALLSALTDKLLKSGVRLCAADIGTNSWESITTLHLDPGDSSEGEWVNFRELGSGAQRCICCLGNPHQAPRLLASQVLHTNAWAHDCGGHLGAHAFCIVPPAMVGTSWLAINHLSLQISLLRSMLAIW